jgi:SAM-dependent methyltransferase
MRVWRRFAEPILRTTGGTPCRFVVVKEPESDLISSQKAFYDELAPHFRDESEPPNRRIRACMEPEVAEAVVFSLAPEGDILELACGSGFFTGHLLRYATSLTALDSSPTMLDRCRSTLASSAASLVNADVFSWLPDRQFDVVFFGFWLSHVPPARFDRFWDLVRRCLKPKGRALFVDEDSRADGVLEDTRIIDGTPSARRTLADGRQFDIVKLFWDPDRLKDRLRLLGWDVSIELTGASTMVGVATDSIGSPS